MSTRSRVGIKNANGTITSIYIHHDGYPAHVGKVLFDNYKDEKKIRELLDLGDLSSIGTEPIDNPNAWTMPKLGTGDWYKAYKEIHPDNMCDTFKSRGEDMPAQTVKDEKAFVKKTSDCWGEYAYLFKDNKWYINPLYDDNDFKELTEKIIEANN